MKRNAVAVAVGALFIAPAAQAQIVFGNDTIGTVQFYGKLYPQFASFEAKGSTQPGASVSTLVTAPGAPVEEHKQRVSVDSQNSYLGFRGERQLGSTGLKAIWQIEQSIGLEFGAPADNVFSNRNSFVGLSGGFGTVKLGNMDTIYKEYGDTFSMFGIKSGNFVSSSNVLSHIGVGNNNAARFHERRANSIQYQTPEFRGFQAGVQYGPDETKGNPGQPLNAELWSYGVKWESSMFYAAVQHERHKDFFGGSNNVASALSNIGTAGATSKDTATRLSGEVRLGAHKLIGDIAFMQWKESGQAAGVARFEKYKHTNWAIGWEANWGGPWRTAMSLVQGGEGECSITIGDCSTTGLKGRMITAGVAYYFDRQTLLYLAGAKLTNDPSARYDNWANGSPNRGADPVQLALGISYSF
jgi:predicted porin